jgi:siroheme synthase-like protein
MLAIHLDVTNKLALVVGGGGVGRRKARTLLDAGATVRLVALQPRPSELTQSSLEWLREPFRDEHLDGVALVVTAASPEVDALVAAAARRRGLWVNAASEPEAGDVYFPATVNRGRLLVTVSTSGAAPALAAHLRDRLEAWLPEQLAVWLDLLEEARALAQEVIPDAERRYEIAQELAALDGPALLAKQGVEAVRDRLRRRVWAAGR